AGAGEAFTHELSHGLRRWIAALPAGVGLATLHAGLRLCVSVPPDRAGLFSAGNGAAMRSAIIGVACAWDTDNGARLADLVSRSSRLTHTDPKATYGAIAVAVGAACFARHEIGAVGVLEKIAAALSEPGAGELRELLQVVGESIEAGETTEAFAQMRYPRGASGYVYQTVPVALHAALSYPTDFRAAVRSVLACGGDTDTVAAITGAIVGANVGTNGVSEDLRRGIWEPTGLLKNVEAREQTFAAAWQTGTTQNVVYVPYPVALARNALFAVIVLYHGFRRLLPPYG
ncbi:MAG: ADP-ribosylglycohydrolase family protein, partial [Armatimonadetes bacterium]|nr:ADP-ribosylglycohydrolase family protein [Armatimonadota bacterium]